MTDPAQHQAAVVLVKAAVSCLRHAHDAQAAWARYNEAGAYVVMARQVNVLSEFEVNAYLEELDDLLDKTLAAFVAKAAREAYKNKSPQRGVDAKAGKFEVYC